MLEVRDLTVRFGELRAVDRVSLAVAEGEVLAVLGPSGCGKSTLLRTIAGLEPVEEGTVHWHGRDISHLPPHRRNFGLMFQDYALFPHRRVAENVAFGLRMRDLPAARVAERTAEVLDLVDLTGYERRPVSNLSGGEQQRVALARTLAPEPGLLMLDEPLGSLDRALREQLVVELAGLVRRISAAVMYVTHDQEEAFALGDRVAVMRAGRVVQVGSPTDVWNDPADEFVARFLGLTNLFPTRVDAESAETPWGPLPAPEGLTGHRVLLIRPESLAIDPNGPVPGTVASRTFRGDHFVVRVATDAGPSLEMAAPMGRAPEVGRQVRLRIDPTALRFLPSSDHSE